MTAILFSFLIAFIISILWVIAIDDMKKNHPDYKKEDFLDWNKNKKNDNNIH